MHWPEAKGLEVLVVEGMLDGMNPAEVMKQYSDRFGNMFGYKPFSSGLMNIRKKHNKEISERNKHVDNDGEYHGLKAEASELNDLEDEDVLDEADEGFEDLADEVSRMGIGSDDDGAETMGFKSVRFTGDTKSFVGEGIARKKRDYHLQPVLPFVWDKWTDEHLRPRLSIQIHGISGQPFHLSYDAFFDGLVLLDFIEFLDFVDSLSRGRRCSSIHLSKTKGRTGDNLSSFLQYLHQRNDLVSPAKRTDLNPMVSAPSSSEPIPMRETSSAKSSNPSSVSSNENIYDPWIPDVHCNYNGSDWGTEKSLCVLAPRCPFHTKMFQCCNPFLHRR
ncbi:hypothetical protein IV203_000095 [Nitzschia inconspicua]|uniref:Uncharacterized protein n=1 Tax=Nitzschia inconspicua TaxID=303405 RepID=A0A9K3PS63_9STRA|nr:hypothetical protein IV203_000095 [Nitzschia inconspicua]